MEYSKEQTKFKKIRNNQKRARGVYFKYFPSQKMVCTKVTIRKRVMMGIKQCPNHNRKESIRKESKEGKTPKIGIKNLGKIKQHSFTKPSQPRRFQPSMQTL